MDLLAVNPGSSIDPRSADLLTGRAICVEQVTYRC